MGCTIHSQPVATDLYSGACRSRSMLRRSLPPTLLDTIRSLEHMMHLWRTCSGRAVPARSSAMLDRSAVSGAAHSTSAVGEKRFVEDGSCLICHYLLKMNDAIRNVSRALADMIILSGDPPRPLLLNLCVTTRAVELGSRIQYGQDQTPRELRLAHRSPAWPDSRRLLEPAPIFLHPRRCFWN